MSDNFDENDLVEWLRDKAPEFSCALAARIALRITPILRDILGEDAEARRTSIVLPGFRALAATNFAGTWPNRFGEVRRAARCASRSMRTAMGETHNEGQMNLIEGREAVSEEFLYIRSLEADAEALGVASSAVDAVAHALQVAIHHADGSKGTSGPDAIGDSVLAAANAAHFAVDGANGYSEFRSGLMEDGKSVQEVPTHVSDFWKTVERDVVQIEEKWRDSGNPETAVQELSGMALWLGGIPTWASDRWADFVDDLPSDESWSVWIDWYEARLVGRLDDATLEAERLTIPEVVWKQGPAHVNSIIANSMNSIKERPKPGDPELTIDRTYQVALSFAGEQRDYVEDVAQHLAARSVGVFYDGFQQTWLWGRDGVEAFHEVFAETSNFVVMFVSAEYVAKPWTRHERKSALSRMLTEESEYVLPVRFDDTPIPGLPESLQYLKANDFTPAQLAAVIVEKIGIDPFSGKASNVPPPRMTSPVGEVVFDYSNFNGRYTIGSGTAEFETKWTKASNTEIHIYNDPASINGVALDRRASSIHEVNEGALLNYTSRTRSPRLEEIVVLRNRHGFYAAIQILDIKDDKRGDDSDQLRFRYAIQTDGSDTFERFVEAFED